ncbi:MAG: SH3 domain-containing protein [Novosphingobium sp.]|nr:SH3 domain-containing protein [Novosphingobium sp.]
MQGLSAPIFDFRGSHQLPTVDSHVRDGYSGVTFTLAGPGVTAQAGHLPVRGDLAHIKLAGLYFVPHYAVPMPRVIGAGGAELRKAAQDSAEAIASLAAGQSFNVLDVAGRWAWGQAGEDGLVGYVPLAALEEQDA